jgi:hypothetical protein
MYYAMEHHSPCPGCDRTNCTFRNAGLVMSPNTREGLSRAQFVCNIVAEFTCIEGLIVGMNRTNADAVFSSILHD